MALWLTGVRCEQKRMMRDLVVAEGNKEHQIPIQSYENKQDLTGRPSAPCGLIAGTPPHELVGSKALGTRPAHYAFTSSLLDRPHTRNRMTPP